APANGSASNAASSDFSAASAAGASDRVGPHFPGADAVHLLGRQDEDLPVTDLACPGSLEDRVHDPLDLVLVGHDLDLHLRHEIDLVLGSAVDLGGCRLAAEYLSLDRGQPVDPDLAWRFRQRVERVLLDAREDRACASGP